LIGQLKSRISTKNPSLFFNLYSPNLLRNAKMIICKKSSDAIFIKKKICLLEGKKRAHHFLYFLTKRALEAFLKNKMYQISIVPQISYLKKLLAAYCVCT